jgi:hypothetical protein
MPWHGTMREFSIGATEGQGPQLVFVGHIWRQLQGACAMPSVFSDFRRRHHFEGTPRLLKAPIHCAN